MANESTNGEGNLPAHAVPSEHGVASNGSKASTNKMGFMSRLKAKFKNMYKRNRNTTTDTTTDTGKTNGSMIHNGEVANTDV